MVNDPILNFSLRRLGRLAGVLYLIIIVTAGFAEIVREWVMEPDNAAATVQNILDSEMLFRLSISSDLVAFTTDIALALVFYVLFRHVSEALALLAAFLRLAQASVLGLNVLNQIAALLVIEGDDYLNSFDQEQLNSLSLFFLNAQDYGYLIGLVFFAVHNVILGYLIVKSDLLPRWIGLLLMFVVSGGYLIDSFGHFLVEDFSNTISQIVIAPVSISELIFCFWLLIKTVNVGDGEMMQRQPA